MKKLFALALVVFGLAACQTEPEGLDVQIGGEQEVMLTVSLPETTRANSAEGAFGNVNWDTYTLRYILEVYRVENEQVLYNTCQRFVETSDGTSMVFPVRLAQGYNYRIVAWTDIVEGDSKDDRYYHTKEGLDNVVIKDNGTVNWNPMDETRDAYTCVNVVNNFSSSSDLDMTLTRPFAKVRVVATDIDDIRKVGLKPTTATVEYSQNMYVKYNAVEDKCIADGAKMKKHEYTYADTASKYEDDDDVEYTLFTDYIFVPSTGTAKFTLTVNAAAGVIKENNFNTEIYVERNKLTTIKGDVLTVGGNVEVKVENEFGELETYTYVNSGAALIKAINSNGKSVLGNNITVDEGDIALAGRLAATRSTDSKSVINLNGFTITVNNKNENGVALITLANNHTLTFAGEGNIVMTSESTAPFVNTATNEAIVIIEQATVTNESQDEDAVVVDGNAIVNAAATVGEGAVSGEVKPQLEYVLANGGEVTLFKDVTSDKILEISATTNPVVINGNGKTISFTSNRGFRITKSNNVTIENATIVNNVNGGRCIETRTGGIDLTLNNVVLTATIGSSQPFTVGGSGNDITVDINNSTLTSGNGGYGITTFNPVALNINNSTVSGYAALNIKAASSSLGSNGSKINIVNSTLNGVNNVPTHESNSFSTIEIEDNNIEINVDSTSTVKATTSNGNGQSIVGFGNSLVTNPISGCELTFAGEIVLEGEHTSFVGCSSYQGGLGNNTVKFAAKYADELEVEGWMVGEPTDGLVTIASAIAQVGDNMYKTLTEAVEAAKNGDTITFVENVVQVDGVVITDKNITIDLNGKTFTVSEGASTNNRNFKVNGSSEVTIKNGTMVAAGDYSSGAYGTLRTEGSANVTLKDVKLYNYRGNGLNVKALKGTTVTINDSEIYSQYGGGVEAAGGTVELTNVKVEQEGMYTAPYNSMAISVNGGGQATVYSGTYSTKCITAEEANNQGTSHGPWCAGVLNSGGTLIIKGGTFSNDNFGDNTLATAARGLLLADTGANIQIEGGTFNAVKSIIDIQNNLGDASKNPTATISGGDFSANPLTWDGLISVAQGKVATQGADGRWTLVDGVMDEAGLKAAFEKGGNIALGADITVSETVTLAEGKTAVFDLNGKTLSGTMHKNDGAVVKNEGTLTVKNGTVKSTANNGGSAIQNIGTLIVNDATLNGAPNADGSWPSYSVNNIGVMTMENTTITSYHGAVASYGDGAVVTLNNCIIDMAGIPGFTSHGIYTYNNGKVVVNGGTYENKATDQASSGASVINGAVEVNAGTFSGRIENYYGTPVLKGGTYSVNPNAKFVAAGYKVIEKDGKYVVVAE